MRVSLKKLREIAAELRASGKANQAEAVECAIRDREQAARLRSLGRAAGRFLNSH